MNEIKLPLIQVLSKLTRQGPKVSIDAMMPFNNCGLWLHQFALSNNIIVLIVVKLLWSQ